MMIKPRIFLRFAGPLILSLATTALAQTTERTTGGCGSETKLQVVLLSTERRYVMKEGAPINVTVRAQNCSKDKVKIEATPFFSFLQEEFGEDGYVRRRFKYSGRVAENWTTTNDTVRIPPGGIHEFNADVLTLEVMKDTWSISLWYPPAKQLEKGDFEFRGAVTLKSRNKDGDQVQIWSSNSIVITSTRQ